MPLFIAGTGFALLTNVLWYRTKFLLRSRGYPVSFFVHHFQDLRYLRQLVNSEADLVTRCRYSRLQTMLYLSTGLTICLFATFFVAAFR